VRGRRKGNSEVRAVIAVTASMLTAITASSIIFHWLNGSIALLTGLLVIVVGVAIVLRHRGGRGEFSLFLCDEKGYPERTLPLKLRVGPDTLINTEKYAPLPSGMVSK
jgi:hypothetical protein